MLNTSENIFNILFGGVIIIHYLCTTLPVNNPDGGEPSGGRVDSTSLYIFLYKPRPLVFPVVDVRPILIYF
jgi:hypothetical protein